MTREGLLDRYRSIRGATEALVEPLDPEDCMVQSMPEASPTKWHLAHTSWFFETFVLRPGLGAAYKPRDERYEQLFNSYYWAVGEPFARPKRGVLSRPTLGEVLRYRRSVDAGIVRFLGDAPDERFRRLCATVELGIQHEQQHQELVLTDLKHAFSLNPLAPVYRAALAPPTAAPRPLGWVRFAGGLCEIGAASDGFAFDNERPRHREALEAYEIADRAVTAGEYLAFVQDGGYRRPELWLADGWDARRRQGWEAPLYWELRDGAWFEHTLGGTRPLEPAAPVCHVSYYEADAFANWAGARLPREAEWELCAVGASLEGNFLESGWLEPAPAEPSTGGVQQLFGDVWEWTSSAYLPYPGYRPPPGALGEYNGKFMCNQMVLRGGSCLSPASHVRATYRNFFGPETRWQVTGIRLAR